MNPLFQIKGLLLKLKREEIKSLLNFLRYYKGSKDDTGIKSALLIELILNDPNSSSRELEIALYGKENYSAFNKLLNRIKDKIYEVILFDQNIAKAHYSERNRIVFEIRKNIVQSEVLYLRGMYEGLEQLQNKIIKKAKDYEIYDSLIEALQAKQRYLGFRYGKKGFEKLDMQIKLFEEKRKLALKSRNLFVKMGTRINESTSAHEYNDELHQVVSELRDDYYKTSSVTIGYYYLFLETELFQIKKDYAGAKNTLLKLLKLVENNVSIYTHLRFGDVLINLANIEIYLNDFCAAIAYILSSLNCYEKNSVPQLVAREMEFYARYYNGEIKEAERIMEDIYNLSRSSNTPILYSKRSYLLACIKTINNDHATSNELLNQTSEIIKDKEGWNVHRRILLIINKIESEDWESADLQVMNLEKFIKRVLKFRYVRKRYIVILRILKLMISEGFDFKKVYEKRKRYFDLLQSDVEEYTWSIRSPELIVFHKWFLAKMNGKQYRFSVD